MIKVAIINTINGREFGQCFNTRQAADVWIEAMEDQAKTGLGWGHAARKVPKKGMGYDNEVDYDDRLVLSEVEEDGIFYAHLKPEYTIAITDISAEMDAQAAREQKKRDAKLYLKNLNVDLLKDVESLKTVILKIVDILE